MPVQAIKSKEEFTAIINGEKPVVIDFTATWCGPCRVISPIFEDFARKNPDIEFRKVDVDEQSDIAQEVGIRAMPTFVLFKKGQKIGELMGADPTGLLALIQKGAGLV